MRTLRVVAGDVYMLCSDGLTDVLDDLTLELIVSENRGPDEHVRALLDAALASGAQDNIAAVVVACHETDVAPKRRPSARPHDMGKRLPPMRGPAGSAPEIIIVGVESHVVPMESASANLLDALGRFARLRQSSVPDIGQPKPSRCADCGQPLEKATTACPTCGTAVKS